MGNTGSNGVHGRRRYNTLRRSHPPHQPEITSNTYVFTATTQYPYQPNYNTTPYYQYPGYYPPPPPVMPLSYDHRMDSTYANWGNGRYPCGPAVPQHAPYVEHQKAVTVRNDVNLKKESLRIEADENNPGKYLVAFDFDATVPGSGCAKVLRFQTNRCPICRQPVERFLEIKVSEAAED